MPRAVALRCLLRTPLPRGGSSVMGHASRLAEFLALAALAVFPPAIRAQNGPQLMTFISQIDGTQQPYALYLPPGFDKTKAYPLVVSLHSEESTHRLNFRQLLGAALPYNRVDPLDPRFYPVSRDVDFIVAFPFARGSIGYQGIAESDVYQMLADVENRFLVDRDRVYLTGISMGGGGALWYALTRPGCVGRSSAARAHCSARNIGASAQCFRSAGAVVSGPGGSDHRRAIHPRLASQASRTQEWRRGISNFRAFGTTSGTRLIGTAQSSTGSRRRSGIDIRNE